MSTEQGTCNYFSILPLAVAHRDIFVYFKEMTLILMKGSSSNVPFQSLDTC